VREIFFDWLRAHRPDLLEHYEALYRRGAYMPRDEQERVTAPARRRGSALRARALPETAPAPAEAAEPTQAALF
jgi:hypothetical protein